MDHIASCVSPCSAGVVGMNVLWPIVADGWRFYIHSAFGERTSDVEGAVLTIWVTALFLFGGLQALVAPLKGVFSYGKISHNLRLQVSAAWVASTASVTVEQCTVRKRTFQHFYVVAVAMSASLAALSWAWSPCKVQLSLMGLEACPPHSLVWVCTSCFLLHSCRRLYECLFVHRFSGTARMHLLVYAGGVGHYVAASLTMYVDVRELPCVLADNKPAAGSCRPPAKSPYLGLSPCQGWLSLRLETCGSTAHTECLPNCEPRTVSAVPSIASRMAAASTTSRARTTPLKS